jgi:ATP-binding cassette subfamily C protein
LIAFLIHPWIGVLAFVGALISLFLAWRNEVATNTPLKRANEAASRAHANFESTVASADVVRALGLRRALVSGHLDDRHNMMQLQTDASLASSGLTATSKFVRLLLQSLALGVAALLAIDAKVSPGAVFASSFIVGRALAPIDQIVGGWKNLIQAWGAYQTLRDLFQETPADVAVTQLPAPHGQLSAENLGVAGLDRRPIIAGISFNVEAGEMIAVVGPSGAGKSTLVKALAGAIVPAAGIIRFDGTDQRNWDPERLAEYVGYMPQEPSLFAGTVKENIARFRNRLGEDQSDVDEAVVAAARTAAAHDLILKLPGGYDYMLGLGGRGLSVGQSQRIALARALFRDPQYLILDEPNSSLDAEGDAQLIQTLEELKGRGRTIMIVAHRLSVLPIVDRLMVIQDGRLTKFGPRDEVLRKIAPPPPPPKSVVASVKASS